MLERRHRKSHSPQPNFNPSFNFFSSMDQRHQAFIIARIVPYGSPKNHFEHRCIGALHHQYCHGQLPLKAATRFMMLIEQEDNAALILEELKAIDGLYGRFGEIPEIPDVPCPFTNFLFLSAWSAELSDGEQSYLSNVSPMEASMGSMEEGMSPYTFHTHISYSYPSTSQTTMMELQSLISQSPKTPPTVFSLPLRILSQTRLRCLQ